MKTARLINNAINEFLQPVPGFSVDQCFHPDILAQCISAPQEAEIGWVWQGDGTFKDAEGNVVYTPPPEPVVEPPVEPPAPAPEPAPAPVEAPAPAPEPAPDTPPQ